MKLPMSSKSARDKKLRTFTHSESVAPPEAEQVLPVVLFEAQLLN